MGFFMAEKNLIVYKSNQIIEASYRLSLNEQRAILACIGQVNSEKALLSTDEFMLSAKDFADFFSISEDRAYSELQDIAKNLYHRSVTIYNPDPKRPKLKKLETRWISSIGYFPELGKITLSFAPKMLPYLSGLQGQFTKYELKHIGNMSSTYGIRLYELLMQWKTTGKREIEIAWLKQQFQIEDKYSSIKDLKSRVIEPAIKDINTHSDYSVSWTQRKTGRNVTHLTFTFGLKEPAQQKPTQTKPAKPKVPKIWERAGFTSEKDYNDYMHKQQMAKYGVTV
jgi:plasmid replication initiation protein